MNKKQIRGFSLVELLVAMVIGLVIISGAFSLYSTTRKTQAVNEMQMDMVADARFAIEMISYDLRHAGMWGATNKEGFIKCQSTDPIACTASTAGEQLPVPETGDCRVGWYYDLTNAVFATDDIAGANPYLNTCIPASEDYVDGTDILEIKYANSNRPAVLFADNVYIRGNAMNGQIFVGNTQPVIDVDDAKAITGNHQLQAYAYYISGYTDVAGDGIPSLRRAALVSGPAMENQTLISGVTDLQVQFGVNADGDDLDTVDRYVNADAVADWSEVYSVKIWLLMRSDERMIGVDTTKSFSIAGSAAVNYGGVDDFRYFLVTSVVNLRNVKQI